MSYSKKQKDPVFLSEGRRDLLASCLVIITAFILAFNVVGFVAKASILLLVVDVVYALLLCGFVLLLTGRSKSEALKSIMSFLGVMGAAVSAYLVWAVFSFQI